jgi:Tfp pilus assembly protein PilF
MAWIGGLIRPGVKGCRGSLSLVLALMLAAMLALGIGCGVRDPRLGSGKEFIPGVRWAPGDPSCTLRTVYYFKLMGQPEMALKELEEAHRLDPANLKVANILAQSCDELGMGRRAQQVYQEALALDPDNPTLLNNLGFSYYLAGNYSQAETYLRQALDRQPNNQTARNNLGLALCRQGRQEEARGLWQEAEGDAVAAQKMAAALAALGMAQAPKYAKPVPPRAPEQVTRPVSPPGSRPGANPVTAAAKKAASPAPPATRPEKIAFAPRAAAASPAPVAASLPKPKVEAAPSRKIPAAKPIRPEVAKAPPSPPQAAPGPVTENRPVQPSRPQNEMAPPPVRAQRTEPQGTAVTGKSAPAKSRGTREAPITLTELVGTNISILNGNGVPDLARETRSMLWGEGFNIVAIGNYLDFGVDRTIIYYRPDAAHVANLLNNRFFPGAEIKPAPKLAHNVDIKVILGHDWLPPQHAEALEQDKARRL